MAEYLVANFELTNPKGYKAYVQAVLPTLEAHNGEVLVAESEPLEGNPGSVTVVIKFETKQALNTWYNSPEYQEVIGLRTDNSEGIAVSAGDFDLEKNLQVLESF